MPPPKAKCEGDKHCPFHGSAVLRGRQMQGTVVRAKVPRMALVEWSWQHYNRKYERYEKKRTRLQVHSPSCVGAKEGERVKIMESRKISKTKSYIIVQRL